MQLRPSSKKNVSRKRHHFSLLVLAVVVAAGLALYVERQPVHDWLRLRSFKPDTRVAALVTDDAMTPYARHLFYINWPVIQDRSAFAQDCPAGNEKTIVLGCYHSGENGIFLLGVSDPRLSGVEEVTAAHEMLHAAYARLSASERNRVDAMLLNYYHHDLTDQRIKTTMDEYQKSEPDQLVNEMHSVFGTEIAQLPAPLEAYYKQYFTNRQAVATYAAHYQQAFTSRQQKLQTYNEQLKSLKVEIDAKKADIQARYADLQSRQTQLQQEKAAGNYQAYNAGVDSYNQQVSEYRQVVTEVHNLITQYNQIVDEHNALVLEEQQLSQDLQGDNAPSASTQ
ncbi:MAG TPA: hypothetical protein VHD60_04395 [Candidatus Saccharimonadales bacterium]|nr:hypothetical protein [Candidatus Saccharimonadales bacterium]